MRRFVIPGLVILVIATSAVGSATPAAASANSNAVITIGMDYWSGAAVEGSNFTQVVGDFTIPQTTASCGARSNLASWVGIGGFGYHYNEYPFAQNGINRDGAGKYNAWYQLFDSAGHSTFMPIPFTFAPGNTVHFGLRFSPTHYDLTFTWNNLTTHTAKSVTLADAGKYWNGHTVDWVNERYPDKGALQPLVHFTQPITVMGAEYSVGSSTALHDLFYAPTPILIDMHSNTSPYPQLATVAHPAGPYPARFVTTWHGCS